MIHPSWRRTAVALMLGLLLFSPSLSFAGRGESSWEDANLEIRAAVDGGDLAAARRTAEAALNSARVSFGPTHMKTAVAMRKLAEIDRLTGDYKASAATLEEASKIWAVNLGAQHPYASGLLMQAADDRSAAKDWAGAAGILKQVITNQKKYYGDRHTAVAATLQELARVQRGAGDADAARRTEVEAAEILLAALPPAHPRTLAAFEALAAHAAERGDVDAARADLKRALTSAADNPNPPLQPMASLLVLNGDLALQERDVIAAGESYAKALSLLEPLGEAADSVRLPIYYKQRELYQAAGNEEAASAAAEHARVIETASKPSPASDSGAAAGNGSGVLTGSK